MPTYKSAAEAIAADSHTPRSERAATDSSVVAGAFVEEFVTSDQCISLGLSLGYVLDVFINGEAIDWKVSRPRSDMATSGASRCVPVSLMWPDGEITDLNPVQMLETRRRFSLRKLFAGQRFLNVYFNGGGALQFLPLWNQSDQAFLLYVDELEPVSPA